MKRGAGGWRTESEERNRASVDNVGERGRNERWHRGGDGDGEGEQTGTCTLITYSPLFPLVLSLSLYLSPVSFSLFFLPRVRMYVPSYIYASVGLYVGRLFDGE